MASIPADTIPAAPPPARQMNWRFIDWIWHVRGSVPLPAGQSSEEAFARLDPLFGEYGTTHERRGDTLTFSKKDQPAQDKMSVFDRGILWVEGAAEGTLGGTGAVLRYHLVSKTLLFCFCLPLLFIGFGQLTIALGKFETPAAEEDKKKDDKKDVVPQLNPIDKWLGAPAPEKPDKGDDAKSKDAKSKDSKSTDGKTKDAKDKSKEPDKKHSPTAAYVFAGIFAALYAIGRVLEDRLVKSLLRKRLAGT